MLYKETKDGFELWLGEPINGVRHPPNIEDLWTEAELLAVGLFKPIDADPVPPGKIIIDTKVLRVGNVVKYVHTLADEPTPNLEDFPLSRRQVRKALVLSGIGIDAIDVALAAMPPGEDKDLAMIDWQDAPMYRRSHPLFNTLAPVIGITLEQLDSLWIWAATTIDP